MPTDPPLQDDPGQAVDCTECNRSRALHSEGVTRRLFLESGALLMVGAALLPGSLVRTALASPSPGTGRRVLVVVFLRGAVDGLSMVIPFREAAYAHVRPTIAVAAPSSSRAGEASLDLDGTFALHPSLAPLKPLYDEGSLAVLQATGSPDPTRSHFDAQDFMESAAPGRKGTDQGWLNRCMALRKGKAVAFRAVAMAATLPRALQGTEQALAIPDLRAFGMRGADERLKASLEDMYTHTTDGTLGAVGRESFESAATLRKVLADRSLGPDHGAVYPATPLATHLRQVAQLIKAGLGLEIACVDAQGWDTHAQQGGARGQLANLLRGFAESLAAFQRDLGDRMQDVTILTMSEFGRKVEENGTGGTDHGHGNCNFVMGGRVRGGKVYGRWPGLERDRLFEGRDLAVTTDFRDVMAEVVAHHFPGVTPQTVFPGYTVDPGRYLGFMRS